MCAFPDLFSLFSEMIMRNLEEYLKSKVGGHNVNNLRYADDSILIAENKEDLQLWDIIKEESRKKRLELDSKKIEIMAISQNNECPQINIFINGNKLKQRDQFKYLGTFKSSDGCHNTETTSRIAQTKKLPQNKICTNISIHTRRRALECYIEPILMYGYARPGQFFGNMWFLWRMLQISWTANQMKHCSPRLLINRIHKRQASFFGHVMRREKLEHLVTSGMIEGKRRRGKQ